MWRRSPEPRPAGGSEAGERAEVQAASSAAAQGGAEDAERAAVEGAAPRDVRPGAVPMSKYKSKSALDSPVEQAGFFSALLFTWMSPIFRLGNERVLEEADLQPLPSRERSAVNTAMVDQAILDEREYLTRRGLGPEVPVRFGRVIRRAYGRRFFWAGVIKFFNDLLGFTVPIQLNFFLKFLQNDDPVWVGYTIAGTLLLNGIIKSFVENQFFYRVQRIAIQVRTAVSSVVYNKSIRLSATARGQSTTGEIVNLMQLDAERLSVLVLQLHVLWSGLFQIAGYMTLLFIYIGPSALAGVLCMPLLVMFQGRLMKQLQLLRKKQVGFTDERVKVTNEALQGIRAIKMYSWVEFFVRRIDNVRTALELVVLRESALLRSLNFAVISASPTIVLVVTFFFYSVVANEVMNPATVFTAVAIFDRLRFPLIFYPSVVAQFVEAQVSLSRVTKFLALSEVVGHAAAVAAEQAEDARAAPQEGAGRSDVVGGVVAAAPSAALQAQEQNQSVVVERCSYSWGETSDMVLSDISFRLRPGMLLAVIGPVGCGKTSLCSALLHEMHLRSGKARVPARVAYVAQSAWILNSSLKENVLFGHPYDEVRYRRVLEASQLVKDLELLPDGDLTEIGERGINLSGGQKQRVSVARAAYTEADLYIFDDPLSALDAEVGRKLFDECILGVLKGRTRIVVTNQLHFLQQADAVLVMDSRPLEEEQSAEAAAGKDTSGGPDAPAYQKTGIATESTEAAAGKGKSGGPDAPASKRTGIVTEYGTYSDLMSHGLDFAKLIRKHVGAHEGDDDEGEDPDGSCDDAAGADEPAPVAGADAAPGKESASQQQQQEQQSNGGACTAASTASGTVRPRTSSAARRSETSGSKRVSKRGDGVGDGGKAPPKNAPATSAQPQATKTNLVTTEEKSVGAVKFEVYRRYVSSNGTRYAAPLVVFLYLLYQVVFFASAMWMSIWTSRSRREGTAGPGLGLEFWLGIYAGIAVIGSLVAFFRQYVLTLTGLRSSTRLHNDVLRSVLWATTQFFDQTPVGRIVARFSKDMDAIDNNLMLNLHFVIFAVFNVSTTLLVIVGVTPLFAAVLPVLAFFYFRMMQYYRQVSRELKRIDSISRSPVYAHFSATLGGLLTIRAYNVSRRFVLENQRRADRTNRANFMLSMGDRWLAQRLEMLGETIVFCAALFAVVQRNSVSPSLAGLSLTFSMAITGLLGWTIRSFASLENDMNSVERITYFTDSIEHERQRLLRLPGSSPLPGIAAGDEHERPEQGLRRQADDGSARSRAGGPVDAEGVELTSARDGPRPPKQSSSAMGLLDRGDAPAGDAAQQAVATPAAVTVALTRAQAELARAVFEDDIGLPGSACSDGVPPEWPARGKITVRGLKVRYRAELDLVLRGFDATIFAGERVGVVGRTGSGKSTFMLCLLRMIEASEGSIEIDGVNIAGVPLRRLRSQVSIIPQEPVLFSGTLRFNLDPAGNASDDELWRALSLVNLKEAVEAKGGLDSNVAEFGDNWSAGQRQLLCMARAVLRRNKVILLDEASSSLDSDTDLLIQRTIRSTFAECTIITIAHRIGTIIDSDRIMVLSDGRLVDMDHPGVLLQRPGMFSDMVSHTGEAASALLRSQAAESLKNRRRFDDGSI